MSNNPFFSVIIPTYNCASLLKNAIASVFEQTYQNLEVIVVDNSSKDDTRQLLDSIKDSRLSVCEVQNHGIISYSRNIGIRKARGKWIAFLDADDQWLPKKLETVHASILERPDVILLCHNVRLVVNGVKKKDLHCSPAVPDIFESLLFHKNCVFTSTVSLRRDIAVKTGGFSERRDFIPVEDFEYWMRLSKTGPFHFLNEVLGEWRIHSNNFSKNVEIQANASICVGEHHLELWLKSYPGMETKALRRKGQLWANAGHTLLKGKKFLEAREFVVKAISFNPFYWKAWAVLMLSIVRLPI
jgi:teichuronic acid biosynthesis glycosyltransferase TuaG